MSLSLLTRYPSTHSALHLTEKASLTPANIITLRTTLLGSASWLVPFVASFLFFDSTGQPIIPQPLFKSLMVVIFGGLGTALLVWAFRTITPTLSSGLALGCYWLAINLALDLTIFVPIVKMPVMLYLQDIGLRYLLIPVIAAGMGVVAGRTMS